MSQDQQIFEFLESFRRITLTMKAEVETGKWGQFPIHVQERQVLIEKLGNVLVTLEEEKKKKAASILIEVLHLDEEIRTKVRELMHQDLLKLKEERDKISALRHFRESMVLLSPPRFLEKEG